MGNKGTQMYKLLSFGDTKNDVFNIISVRNRQKDNDIEFLFRISQDEFHRVVYKEAAVVTHHGNYRSPNDKDFSYIKIVVTVDTVNKQFNYLIGDKKNRFKISYFFKSKYYFYDRFY